MNNQDLCKHLETLELKPGASWEEIKVSYRELVQIWHPDRFHGNANLQERSHQKLQNINASYEALKYYCEHNGYKTPTDNSQDFNQKPENNSSVSNVSEKVICILSQVPGMTQAHKRDFNSAAPKFKLSDGSVLKTWKNPVGVDHVFIADREGNMIYGGFVGWIHSDDFHQAISKIQKEFT
jgi:DnaJ-class molecular chaperone